MGDDNKREMRFNTSLYDLHKRSHAVVSSIFQDRWKTWDWWGPPSRGITVEDVYRFSESYLSKYGPYLWGAGNDPKANSCQSFCRNFETAYKNGSLCKASLVDAFDVSMSEPV